MKAKRRAETISQEPQASVLAVEDEQDLQDLLSYNLARNGFAVRCAPSAEEAAAALRKEKPDIVLLDLMLPGMDGLTFCRKLKADPSTAAIPIVMLTAKGEEADIVVGLEMGADDYVTKPFSPRVLIARVKAVLRRPIATPEAEDDDTFGVGELQIDTARHEVRAAGKPVPLTHTEFSIVAFLSRRPGRVFTRDQIIHGVHGGHVAVTDRSMDVHIASLRRKLGDAGRYIQTVRGVGYRAEET